MIARHLAHLVDSHNGLTESVDSSPVLNRARGLNGLSPTGAVKYSSPWTQSVNVGLQSDSSPTDRVKIQSVDDMGPLPHSHRGMAGVAHV